MTGLQRFDSFREIGSHHIETHADALAYRSFRTKAMGPLLQATSSKGIPLTPANGYMFVAPTTVSFL